MVEVSESTSMLYFPSALRRGRTNSNSANDNRMYNTIASETSKERSNISIFSHFMLSPSFVAASERFHSTPNIHKELPDENALSRSLEADDKAMKNRRGPRYFSLKRLTSNHDQRTSNISKGKQMQANPQVNNSMIAIGNRTDEMRANRNLHLLHHDTTVVDGGAVLCNNATQPVNIPNSSYQHGHLDRSPLIGNSPLTISPSSQNSNYNETITNMDRKTPVPIHLMSPNGSDNPLAGSFGTPKESVRKNKKNQTPVQNNCLDTENLLMPEFYINNWQQSPQDSHSDSDSSLTNIQFSQPHDIEFNVSNCLNNSFRNSNNIPDHPGHYPLNSQQHPDNSELLKDSGFSQSIRDKNKLCNGDTDSTGSSSEDNHANTLQNQLDARYFTISTDDHQQIGGMRRNASFQQATCPTGMNSATSSTLIDRKVIVNCLDGNDVTTYQSNGNNMTTSANMVDNKNVRLLQLELNKYRHDLITTQKRCQEYEETIKQVDTIWKKRMNDCEAHLQRQVDEKEQQLKNIISRLLSVEEDVRKEQAELKAIVKAKEKVIEMQDKRIRTLESINAKTISVLNDFRARYSPKSSNKHESHNPLNYSDSTNDNSETNSDN